MDLTKSCILLGIFKFMGVSFYSWLIFENIPDENFARKLSKKKPNQPIDQSFISIIVLGNSVLLLGIQNKANK